MAQAHKCLKWNIKGWWPFFEWPSSSHLLRGWLCISVRAKEKRTFNKALWDTHLWLATALLSVQNITIYHHDSGVWAESRLRCQENWQRLVCVWICVHICVWEALPSLRALHGCDTQCLSHFIVSSLLIARNQMKLQMNLGLFKWLCTKCTCVLLTQLMTQLSSTWVIILSSKALII